LSPIPYVAGCIQTIAQQHIIVLREERAGWEFAINISINLFKGAYGVNIYSRQAA